MDFPCGSAGEESACSVGDLSSISGLGRSPGEVPIPEILAWRICLHDKSHIHDTLRARVQAGQLVLR